MVTVFSSLHRKAKEVFFRNTQKHGTVKTVTLNLSILEAKGLPQTLLSQNLQIWTILAKYSRKPV
jgi:hypothetical protein